MKCLILSSLLVLLMSAVTAPAVRSEVKILGTLSNPTEDPATDPGNRLASGTPSDSTIKNQIP